jgi:predicted O-linked N-acetylglucosamine transferase (SPINDLY family)
VDTEATFAKALTMYRDGRAEAAATLCRQVLKAVPAHAPALHLLGVMAIQANHAERAEQFLAAACAANPHDAQIHLHRGIAQFMERRFDAALVSFDRAISLNPGAAEAHFHRGNALDESKQHMAAVASFDRAIALGANHADAWNNRGIALFAMNQFELASASFQRALEMPGACAATHFNLGNALYELRRYESARAAYDRCLALDARNARAYDKRAQTLAALGSFAEAIADYERALALNPAQPAVLGSRLYLKMLTCDWRGFEAETAALLAGLERATVVASPFCLLAVVDSPSLQRIAAERWIQSQHPPVAADPAWIARRARLRIGYFSSDFQNHATMQLMAGLFEAHDRTQFEVFVFSYGPPSEDAMRTRLRAACERFIDIRNRSDAQAAAIGRDLEIDIAVDLKGFTRDGRPGIFARRAAPVQVHYLGYPGTLGAPFIDYLVADRIVVPASCRPHYRESIVYLPNCYQVNDANRPIANATPAREQLGLPKSGVVFCCFNSPYKITPSVFASWMRILARVGGSVFWLLADNPGAVANLRQAAIQHGVDATRLVFAPRLAPPEHLARHRAADLALDTWPCGAHTTASDALWAGLPLLTLPGATFASRVAASLLTALDLPQLIAASAAAYEETAVQLATAPGRLAQIRAALAVKRQTSPLFATTPYARDLEAAYTRIHERHLAGQPPADLEIP